MSWRTQLYFISAVLVFTGAIIKGQESGQQHWRQQDIIGSVSLIKWIDPKNSLWQPCGTGVFLDVDSSFDHIFFVTNRHIYMGRDSMNVLSRTYRQVDTVLHTEVFEWVHRKHKAALCPTTEDSDFVAIPILRNGIEGIRAIASNRIIHFQELEYGDDVLFYGYPNYAAFGLNTAPFNFPIVRSGVISHFALGDVYVGTQKVMIPKMFLIDGVSIGGGSGSPIFVKRLAVDNTGRLSFALKFAGVIKGHYLLPKLVTPYPIRVDSQAGPDDSELLDSTQFKYVFRLDENSNLAFAISSDLIIEFIRNEYPKLLQKK